MTSAATVAFLTEAGLIAKVWPAEGDGYDTISFKVRDVAFAISADEADADYLKITCAYRLQSFPRDPAKSYEAMLALQAEYKVAKIGIDLVTPTVTVAAEQFVPQNEAFSRVFWRSLDLTAEVALRALKVLNDVTVVGIEAALLADRVAQSLRFKDDS